MNPKTGQLLAGIGGLVSRIEVADEACVACHLGLAHVDIDLSAVHEHTSVTFYISF